MLNPLHSLERLHIRTDHYLNSICDTENQISESVDQKAKAINVIENVLGISPVEFDAHKLVDHVARVTAKHVVMTVVKAQGKVLDPAKVLEDAKAYALVYVAKESNQWIFAEREVVDNTVTRAVVKGIDVKVAVRSDGKIKKGGKQVLAAELYKKHVTESKKPVDNQGFIAILMKELDMSKAGATTYAYNCKKQMGVKS